MIAVETKGIIRELTGLGDCGYKGAQKKNKLMVVNQSQQKLFKGFVFNIFFLRWCWTTKQNCLAGSQTRVLEHGRGAGEQKLQDSSFLVSRRGISQERKFTVSIQIGEERPWGSLQCLKQREENFSREGACYGCRNVKEKENCKILKQLLY